MKLLLLCYQPGILVNEKETLLICGDFNSRIGKAVLGYEDIF